VKIKPLTEQHISSTVKTMQPIYNLLKKYHNHSAIGIEKINSNKNYLCVVNHSLATYDIILLVGALLLEKKIFLRAVVDNLIYKTPIINKLNSIWHIIPGSYKSLKEILSRGESVLIAPGGMKESLRSSKEKKQIYWEDRFGFISLSIVTQTPIIIAACPHSDDIYDVYDNPLTKIMFKKFRLPLPIAKGRSFLCPFIPKKVQLTHYIDGPYEPPKYTDGDDLDLKIKEFHEFISQRMKALLTTN
jgi:hypothetical protein